MISLLSNFDCFIALFVVFNHYTIGCVLFDFYAAAAAATMAAAMAAKAATILHATIELNGVVVKQRLKVCRLNIMLSNVQSNPELPIDLMQKHKL